jgi:hypothetical protein
MGIPAFENPNGRRALRLIDQGFALFAVISGINRLPTCLVL